METNITVCPIAVSTHSSSNNSNSSSLGSFQQTTQKPPSKSQKKKKRLDKDHPHHEVQKFPIRTKTRQSSVYDLCGKYIFSVTFLTLSVSVITFGIMAAIEVHAAVNISITSLQASEMDRGFRFNKTIEHLTSFINDVKGVVRVIEGFLRTFNEMIIDGDHRRLLRVFSPLVNEFVKTFGYGSHFTVGVWNHWQKDNWNSSSHNGIFFDNGNLIICNNTHRIVHNTSTNEHVMDDYSAPDWDYYFDHVEPSINYGHETYFYYALPHEIFDYWVGEITAGVTPFMSFSVALGEITGPGSMYLGGYNHPNSWFGMPIYSFSEYLREITPSSSVTWVVDIGRMFLLASSDAESADDLVADDGWTFLDWESYQSPVVRSVTKRIISNSKLLDSIITAGGAVSVDSGNYNVQVHYVDEIVYGAEWLIINAKSKPSMYGYSIFYISFVVSVFVGLVLGLSSCWCVVGLCVRRSYSSLLTMMKNVKTMELELVVPSKFGFWEFRKLQKDFYYVAQKLKLFRAFIPASLYEQGGVEAAGSSFGSNSSSNSSHDARNIRDLDDSPQNSQKSGSTKSSGGGIDYGDDGKKIDDASGSRSNSQNLSIYTVDHTCDGRFAVGLFSKIICVLYIDFVKIAMQDTHNVIKIILSQHQSSHLYEFGIDYVKVIMLDVTKLSKLAEVIWKIREILKEFANGMFVEGVRFFLCVKDGVYGNMGNSRIKKFVCGGGVMKNLDKMRVKTPEYVTSVANDEAAEILKHDFETRMVSSGEYEIGNSLAVEPDEWMYELAAKEKLKRWIPFGEAVEKFISGHTSVALKLFEEFLQENPDDKVAAAWIERIRSESSEKVAEK